MTFRRTIYPTYKATRLTLAERRAAEHRRQLERVDPPLGWVLSGPAWPCCPDWHGTESRSDQAGRGLQEGFLNGITPALWWQLADGAGVGAANGEKAVVAEAEQLVAADPAA